MDLPLGPAFPQEADAPSENGEGTTCPRCGEHNSVSARFCQQCATSLVEEPPELEPARRIVGIAAAVACEVFGEGELERVREVLERHGGAVESPAESLNTVVAVFGPEPPEGDGPLRAVWAASEIRDTAPATEELGTDEGPPTAIRAGVGTCDVLEGDLEERSARRAIDLAVRLQSMASPGEVILAEGVRRLVGDLVSVEPVDPRAELDGDEPTGPLRLLGIAREPSGTQQLADAPLVGRDREREELREHFERAVSERAGRLVAVIGEAGVGKTRIVEEFLRELEEEGEAAVLRIRCRPSEEGGATWPLADIVERAAGIDDEDSPDEVRRKVDALLEDAEDVSTAIGWIANVIALPGGTAMSEEPSRALGRLLTTLASRRPLVLSVDDAHRADPSFWHLLREVTGRTRDLPLLVLCAARELPAAVGASDGLDAVHLEPLPEEELGSLIRLLLGGCEMDPEVRQVVAGASGGNPFVAEQMLDMLIEEDLLRREGGRFASTKHLSAPPTPPGVRAVLEARLEWLSPEEQTVVGLAAVVGETFPWDLMAGLLPENVRPAVPDHLDALVRKRLIRPEPGAGFAFRHSLVREAAGRSVPDEARAEVHEYCATWLEQATADAALRHAEVIGSHLASASEIRTRLEIASPETRELGERAAAMLEGAAVRAAQIGDGRGALLLFDRASSLLPNTDPQRSELLLRSALALAELGEPRVDALLNEAGNSARASGARAVEWRAKVLSASLGLRAASDIDSLERARTTADKAIEVFEELEDDRGLSWAWSLRGSVYRRWGHTAACALAAERAAEHARRAGDRPGQQAALRDLAWATLHGPARVDDAVERCEGIVERLRGDRPAEQDAEGVLAVLTAYGGGFDEARELVTRAATALEALDLADETATCLFRSGLVETLAGEHDAAEVAFRRALELAEGAGNERIGAQAAAALAHLACERGRAEEAIELTAIPERSAAGEDIATQVGWRTAKAKALAHLDRFAEADALARVAVRLAEQTDASLLRAEALKDLAEVLRLAGRTNEAMPLAKRALRGFDRRGAEAQATAARGLLERLGARGSNSRHRATAPVSADGPYVGADSEPGTG